MEQTSNSRTIAEKMVEDKDSVSSAVEIDDEVGYVMTRKKSMLPKVIIGLLIVVIVLVGVLLAVQYFNQGSGNTATNSDIPAGVSPDSAVVITEDENGNMTATDGNGNPIDLGDVEMDGESVYGNEDSQE